MRFDIYGKTCQLRVENADDLGRILKLDESLWVATSAPAGVFRCDQTFLRLMDNNDDGRINTREVREAIRWMLGILEDSSMVADNMDTVPIAVMRDDTREGRALADSARSILKTVGTPEEENISLDAVRRFLDQLRQQPMNGDGVIIPAAASESEIAQYIADIVTCTGGTDDACGEKGATSGDVERFQDSVAAYLQWLDRGRVRRDGNSTEIMPFGRNTAALYETFRKNADKVDLFFALCRAIRFEPRALSRLGCADADMNELDFTKLEDLNSCLEKVPIAKPVDNTGLPLHENAVNPLYRSWIGELRDDLLPAVLGKTPEFLEEADWQKVKDRLKPYEAYLNEKPGGGLESVPVERLRIYADGAFAQKAAGMIEADAQVTEVLDGAREMERLLLYHKHLVRFVNNFVNFRQLYEITETALFEIGSAVIDGRWFSLALKVDDPVTHEKLARTSNIFTMYVEVTGKEGDKKFLAAIPATSGSRGNLCVGKRGVFFDTEDREYNVRIVKIISNPISLREALVSPFVRLWEFVIGKIESMAGASEKELQKKTDSMMSAPGSPAAQAAGGPAGMLVGISLSAAAIGSAMAFVTKTLADMSTVQILFSLMSAALVVAIPVTLIAVIKLRRQDLSSLLEGCGWAINARMRFNRAQRRQFTKRIGLPEGSSVAPRRRWLGVLLVIILLVLIVLTAYLYGL